MAIGLADYSNTLTLGRRRVVVSNDMKVSPQVTSPLKKICSRGMSSLDDLPREILVIIEI